MFLQGVFPCLTLSAINIPYCEPHRLLLPLVFSYEYFLAELCSLTLLGKASGRRGFGHHMYRTEKETPNKSQILF